MEPISIAAICTAVFGAVAALSAFVRQLLISRDKSLNDKAHHRAMAREAKELEKVRAQMECNKRYDTHYQVLGENKDAIEHLDKQIEAIFAKKVSLIERYSQTAMKESSAVTKCDSPIARKSLCDVLHKEIDLEIKMYDQELVSLQNRRSSIWENHHDLQHQLLQVEKERNVNLDNVYNRHTEILEKVFLRHIELSDGIAKETLEAGNKTYISLFKAPIEFLKSIFSLSSGISPTKMGQEKKSRQEISNLEEQINGADNQMESSSLLSNFSSNAVVE